MDITPRPCTCVQGPKKIAPSAHHRDDELHATSFTTGATVGARLCPPRRHLWNSLDLHTSITVSKSNRGISKVNETMGISLCITTGMSCTTGTTGTSITVSSNWRRCVCVDRTPTHNTHLCSAVCSQARNAHHALGSRASAAQVTRIAVSSLCA